MAIAETPGSNKKTPKNEILLNEGFINKNLIILHQGSVELFNKNSNNKLNDVKNLLVLKAPVILAADSFILNKPLKYSLKTSSESIISVYPSNLNNLLKIIASKPNIPVTMMRTLLTMAIHLMNLSKKTNELTENIQKSEAITGLGYSFLQPEQFIVKKDKNEEQQQDISSFEDSVLKIAKDIYNNFNESEEDFPLTLNKDFFEIDISEYIDHLIYSNQVVDADYLEYIKKIISFPSDIVVAICKKDPKFIVLTLQKLSEMIEKLSESINDSFELFSDSASNFYQGDYSWIEKTAMTIDLFQQNLANIKENEIVLYSQNLMTVYFDLTEKISSLYKMPITGVDDNSIEKIKSFSEKEKFQPSQEEDFSDIDENISDDTQVGNSSEISNKKILAELENSTAKIIQWAGVDRSKLVEYQNQINDLLKFKNPLDSTTDVKRLRRTIGLIYWDVYEAVMLKHLQQNVELPRFVEMFINYGFFDEKLLEEKQLVYLYNLDDNYETQYPILNTVDWLTGIYKKEIPTSINELGLTYFELLRQENRNAKWKKEKDLPENLNTGEARLKFEIRNMLTSTAKLTSGTIMNHFNILTKYHFIQDIEKSIVSKKVMTEHLDKLLSIDFSAFHREVLYEKPELGINREFIQTQIIPNFILVPSIGNNCQFWQEREGRIRTSRGRLILPAMHTEDLYTMILKGTAAYRWELTKLLQGVDWNNISQSSITADYTDYIQFFKKNRDLSVEAKEKLSAEIKRFRDDRSRYINDYLIWMKYESEGTMRFNKVARKIFAKHIPFTKVIREMLIKLPAYTDIINKTQNIRKNKARHMEPRIKKIRMTNSGVVPQEILDTQKFFNLEI